MRVMTGKIRLKNRILAIFMVLCLVLPFFGIKIPDRAVAAVVGPASATELTGGTPKTLSSGLYYVTKDVSYTNTSAGGNGLAIKSGATVYIYIPSGCTLTATGGAGNKTIGGGAGIYLPSGATLILLGEGTVKATGGKGGNGGSGDSGYSSNIIVGGTYTASRGGTGGTGGGGGGAGIGTSGGTGASASSNYGSSWNPSRDTGGNGKSGTAGNSGSSAVAMGTLYQASTITINATGGTAGTKGSNGSAGSNAYTSNDKSDERGIAGGAGGGGGGAGYAGANIGTGGGGGGQGGGGGSAGYIWGAYYVGAGGGGGGAGSVTGTGGTYSSYSQFSTAKDRTCGRTQTATSGSGTSGGQGASAYIYNSSGSTKTSGTGGSGGSGGSAGSAATSKSAQVLTNAQYLSYTVTFAGADNNASQEYYFSQNNTITVPDYTPEKGKSFWGWKVTAGASTLPTQSKAKSVDSDSLLAEDATIYQPGDVITLGTATYGNVTLKALVHEWSFSVSESATNTIRAICSSAADGCVYHDTALTVTLDAEDMEYSGNSYNKVSVSDEITGVAGETGATLGSIKYYKVSDDGTETELPSAPYNVGNYKAKITLTSAGSDYTAEDTFVIEETAMKDKRSFWQTWRTDSNFSLFRTLDWEVQAVSLEEDIWALNSIQQAADGAVTEALLTNRSKPTSLTIKLQDDMSMEGIEIEVYQILSITDVKEDGSYSYTLSDKGFLPFFSQYFQVPEDELTDTKILELLGSLEENRDKNSFANALKVFIDTENSDGDEDYITPMPKEIGIRDQYSMTLDISRQYKYKNGVETYSRGLGYYFITRSDAVDDTYTLRVIDEPQTTLTLKGSALSISKSGDQVVMKVGDIVNYTLESKMLNTVGSQDFVYIIYDWLEETMEADMDSFQVYVLDAGGNKEPLAEGADYTIKKTTQSIEGQTELQEVIAITFLFDGKSVFYQDAHMGDTILVNYKAKMTKTATNGTLAGRENHNRAWIEYGRAGDTDTTVKKKWDVYTLSLSIHKTDESGKPLKNAEFILYEVGDFLGLHPLKFSRHSDGYYYYDNVKGVSTLITDEEGNIEIHGLDETSLKLKETKPPAGYQAVDTQIITITINENVKNDRFLDLKAETDGDNLSQLMTNFEEGSITLTIKDPTEGSSDLPATGGRGRILIYVIGSLMLMAGIGGFVISRKRKA